MVNDVKKYGLNRHSDSIKQIYDYCFKYWMQLLKFNKCSLIEFFDIVRKIPYFEDKGLEIIQTPDLTLSFNRGDCKKKSVLMGSYFNMKKIPFRLVTMSETADKIPHHVFTQFFDNGLWINADATYSKNRIGESKYGTKFYIY